MSNILKAVISATIVVLAGILLFGLTIVSVKTFIFALEIALQEKSFAMVLLTGVVISLITALLLALTLQLIKQINTDK